jgi:hypothetical protein
MAMITSLSSRIFICILVRCPFREASLRAVKASFTSFSAMAWQKTFTLAKRSKGCYLVTEEVLSHMESGLNGVQV